MLTAQEKNEIEEEIKVYPYPSAACLDALKIIQQHRGWVPDESVVDIAELLSMSTAQVEGVASFYSRIYRYEVGHHVILICDGISCMIMGYEAIYDHISGKLGIRLGETTHDKKFTLLPISCLGDCDNAPSMMIDNEHYNRLTIKKIDQILEKYS